VPGHGPLGTLADSTTLRGYIDALLSLTREAIGAGQAWDEFKQHVAVPAAYAAWGNRSFFRRNLKYSYKRLTGQV
jgi:hypothetical protein